MDIERTFSNHKDTLLLNNDIPPGTSLIMPEIIITKGFGTETVVTIVISVATGIPSGLIATWLYDKLKQHRSCQISINRKEVHFSEREIINRLKIV